MLIFSRFPFEPSDKTSIGVIGDYIGGFTQLPQLDPLSYYDTSILNDETVFDSVCASLWTTNMESRRVIVRTILNLYYGNDVVFLVDDNIEYYAYLSEVLAKYIQDMYGYISCKVREPEDTSCLVEGTFSDAGLMRIEMDLKWYKAAFGSEDLPDDPPDD
jgi:hypothetical protein